MTLVPVPVPTPVLREALTSCSSIAEAAHACGIGQQRLRTLAYEHHLGGLFEALRRRGLANTGKAREGQYNFVDMVGRELAGVVVLKRAANLTGNATWECKHACGHVARYEGIRLRAQEKAGRPLRCKVCDPRRIVRKSSEEGARG